MLFEALASATGGSDWFYVILMEAPLNSDITVDDGDETVYATGRGIGNYIGIPVTNAGSAYTITVEANGLTAPTQTVNTPASSTPSGGISDIITVNMAKVHITFESNFKGQTLSITDGTHTASPAPTIPNATGVDTMDIYLPYTGSWTMTATDPVSGDPFNVRPYPTDIVSLTQIVDGNLSVIPNGSTVLPINDIEIWLACADIKNTGYTTLEEVLADEDVLRRLLTSDNANDYLVRSKTWSVNPGKVPVMQSDTVPSGQVFYTTKDQGSPYTAFTEITPVSQYGWLPSRSNTASTETHIGYIFDTPTIVRKIRYSLYYGTVNGIYFQGSNDTTNGNDGTWTDLLGPIKFTGDNCATDVFHNLNNNTAYKAYRFTNKASVLWTYSEGWMERIQFYGFRESIPENAKAMQIIGADDYAANTLLGDSDWRSAIWNSEYKDSVYNTTVPKMTSATEPRGEAGCYPSNYTDYYGWKAFNGDNTTNGAFPSSFGGNIWYKFITKKNIKGFDILLQDIAQSHRAIKNVVQLVGSNNGTTWTDVSSEFTMSGTDVVNSFEALNNNEYLYWGVKIVRSTTGHVISNGYGYHIQFYGREAGGVQTLLKAAGITNKPYLTIEEVLADHETVQKIMYSHDAVDYLATAKLFIDAVTSDAFAMRCIGLRNYAADTLLADSEWCEAIGKSDYVDFVLNTKVPTMTSNTTPSGEVIYNQPYSGYAASAYLVFDDNDTTSELMQNVIDASIGYDFVTPVCVKGVRAKVEAFAFVVEASNTGTANDWVTIGTQAQGSGIVDVSLQLNNNDEYRYYRIRQTAKLGSANSMGWYTIQFYGRIDVDETKLQVFSAANDSFSLQDSSTGSLSPIDTTDSTGHVEIAKTAIPTGQQTLYSGVAKNPNKLTDDYFKRVNIDDWTSIIELMPDDALYWYGYISPDFQDMSTANGWTGNSSYPITTPTHNTNDILLPYYNGSSYCGVGRAKITDEDVEFNSLVEGITFASGNAGQVGYSVGSKLVSSSDVIYNIPDVNVIHKVGGKVPKGSYPWIEKTGTRDTKIHASWLDKDSQTPTFLSAANDVLSILDGGRTIPFAITNMEGKSYEPMLLPGSYDIFSSVIGNHKVITVTSNTTQIDVTKELMPNNALLWYGHVGPLGSLDSTPIIQDYASGTQSAANESLNDGVYSMKFTEGSDGFGGFARQLSKNAIDFSAVSSIKILSTVNIQDAGTAYFSLLTTPTPITAMSYKSSNGGAPYTTPSHPDSLQITGDGVLQTINTSAITSELYLNLATWLNVYGNIDIQYILLD